MRLIAIALLVLPLSFASVTHAQAAPATPKRAATSKRAPAPKPVPRDLFKTLPACYKGELKIEGTEEVRPVYLELRGRSDADTFLTRVFQVGADTVNLPFKKASPTSLRFNKNDDTDSSGSASFNTDIELTFTKTGAVGTYKSYSYGSSKGLGGYGQSEVAGVQPTEVGQITLETCRISTPDFLKALEAERGQL